MGACVKLDGKHSSVTQVLIFSLLNAIWLLLIKLLASLHITEFDHKTSKVFSMFSDNDSLHSFPVTFYFTHPAGFALKYLRGFKSSHAPFLLIGLYNAGDFLYILISALFSCQRTCDGEILL